jgi:Mn-dependent DtxR family transcriptional regulator
MAPDGNIPTQDNSEPIATTTIDALPDLLRAKGRMEISEIAATFNVNEKVAADWAKLLEEGGMVKILYEMGKMYVELKSPSA